MPTTLETRFAVLNETLRTTREKLAELSQVLTKLKAGDPRAGQLHRQFMEINERRQQALDEQGQLIEAARAALKTKNERLEQLRKGGK